LVRLTRSLARFTAPLLALALLEACSKSSGNPIPSVTLTPIPGSSSIATLGTAYIPDGGSGVVTGVQVVHFEDVNGNLLLSPTAGSTPGVVAFPASVGPLAFASDGSVAVSADSASSGAPFTQIQDIFGLATAALTPVGTPYNVTSTPAPGASSSPTPVPSITPTITDVTGLAIAGTGVNAIAVAVGANSNGVLGVSSLENAPPEYAQLAPFSSPSYTISTVPPGARNSIVVAKDSSEALVRGTSDFISYTLSSVATGYEFNATAYSTALAAPNALRGHGAMAYDPVADGTAIVLQAPQPNDVTLITGLPGAINIVYSVALPSVPYTVAWAPNGASAIVGTDNGYYGFWGMGSNVLNVTSTTTPTQVVFTGCDGVATDHLTSVTSAAISLDGLYLALFGPSSAASCSTKNGALVVVPFVPPGTTASPTPAPSPGTTAGPSIFVQNNLTVPAPVGTTASKYEDYMNVR
jgi:hypothetical protein